MFASDVIMEQKMSIPLAQMITAMLIQTSPNPFIILICSSFVWRK
jgi:hypothetical protein